MFLWTPLRRWRHAALADGNCRTKTYFTHNRAHQRVHATHKLATHLQIAVRRLQAID